MLKTSINPRRWLTIIFLLLAVGGWQGYGAWVRSKPALPVETQILSSNLQESAFRLGNLSLGGQGHVYGSRGVALYRITDNATQIEPLFIFKNRISAIHEREDGLLIVATDDGRWQADKPCRIYRSRDGGRRFEQIKTIEGGTVLWWSLDSDQGGRLYLAEYGPQKQGMSKTLWRSEDDGDSWRVIFKAPDENKIHLHRIAVDPYTEDLWLTIGDGKNRNMLHSTDHGDHWQQVDRIQATAVAFGPDAIYWGRDKKGKPGLLRYDRKGQRFETYFNPRKYGNYGGSVYDIVRLDSGDLIVPFMKYPDQDHVSSVWRVNAQGAKPILLLASESGKGVAIETIAGPDKDGWVYWTGYQLKVE